MDESNMRGWKAIGIAAVAPAALYFLIFQHFRCDTTAEQITALVLATAGFAAAMNFA